MEVTGSDEALLFFTHSRSLVNLFKREFRPSWELRFAFDKAQNIIDFRQELIVDFKPDKEFM